MHKKIKELDKPLREKLAQVPEANVGWLPVKAHLAISPATMVLKKPTYGRLMPNSKVRRNRFVKSLKP